MSNSSPDPHLQQLFAQLVTRAFEEAREHEEREQKIADAQLAARGTYLSGANLVGRAERGQAAFRTGGRRSIEEVIKACGDVYGTIPPEIIAWVREQLSLRFKSYAQARSAAFGDDRLVRQLKIPTVRFEREFNAVANGLVRDLEIALGPLELRGRLAAVATGQLPSAASGPRLIDAFICHSGQDKATVARPLSDDLKARGFSVWLDEYELIVGKSVYAEIDRGLRSCRFGVVILSPGFFARTWPQNELHALAALGAAEGRSKILPVWHEVDHSDVANFSPLLADVFAAKTSEGLNKVVDQISAALNP
jgi:hypothetical protein